MNFLNNSFTAHLRLHFFLTRCILLTGLILIPACTSPLIRAQRFDSPDWQLQWQDTGGIVPHKCDSSHSRQSNATGNDIKLVDCYTVHIFLSYAMLWYIPVA